MTVITLLVILAAITFPSIIWLYALADITINSFKTFGTKIIWLLTLCFFPPVGTLLYFLIGRSQRRTHYPVGRLVLICILLFPLILTTVYYLQAPVITAPIEEKRPAHSIQI